MHYKLNGVVVSTFLESDPYIPMSIRFGEGDLDVERMGIYGPDGDLLEIAASLSNREIRELTLVHCGHFRVIESAITVPCATSGILAIDMPDHVDVPSFDLEVFSDGVCFTFGEAASHEYLRSGNVTFGFTEDGGSIAEVFISGLTANAIDEMVSTLEFYQSQKDAVLFFDASRGISRANRA